LFTLFTACQHAEPSPGARATTSDAAPAGAPHDEAALIERTKAFFHALDTADVDAAKAMLAPDFMRISMARFFDSKFLLGPLERRKASGFPTFSDRELTLTRVRFFGDAAVFTGMSTVKMVRAKDVAPATLEQSEHLVWTYRDGAWLLASIESEMAGPETDRARWNETFRFGAAEKLEPNKLLVETVHGVHPGKALDVGIGQGRNSLYLASQGWDVTGIDISDEGIRQANETAAAAGLTLHTENVDHNTWDWGTGQYDLIAFIYMGPKPDVAKMRTALKPGGLVVIEYFMDDGANKGTGLGGFTHGQLATLFQDGFEIVRNDEVVDVADWGMQKVPLVRFVARKK
jgi:predicted O-methyltransferase YrrM